MTRRTITVAACLSLLGAELLAQHLVPVDPYTEGDAAAMQRAGYVSFGPFPFGPRHTSRDVEELLGDEELHWVETAHFRLGSAVSEIPVRGTREWRRRLKKELQRLGKRVPRIPAKVTVLDPWLRTHLIAQRLEDCYATLQGDLGVSDADFPDQPMTRNGPPSKYYGDGPYLGMAQKFSVLIVDRGASAARYTRAYAGFESLDPLRLYHHDYGGFGLCIAEDANDRLLEIDEALHTHIVYNVVTNLIQAYRANSHDLPAWLTIGLAHHYSRATSPKYPVYERQVWRRDEESGFWEWDKRAIGLMRNGAFGSVGSLMQQKDRTAFEMEQHIQTWFFVDHLMQTKKAQTMRFLHAFKDPFHAREAFPTREELEARQAECFAAAMEMAPAAIEAEWYKRKRIKRRRTKRR